MSLVVKLMRHVHEYLRHVTGSRQSERDAGHKAAITYYPSRKPPKSKRKK